ATLEELDENDLMRVLVEPKDSISKQYQKILEMENVKLKFTDGALRAVSRLAVNRKAGARGLRAILENTMLDIMYDIPSRSDVKEVIINEDVVKKGETPILLFESKTETA
ncbi:MAG: ATP-dependent Clp protease ATP-binding subunit ClpX, partial [Syntrophaceae bacterium]|nr:ATP-dependent Clp protease ATP-binding subunit ClpX [Syntrophaceae bacterium]